MSVSTPVRPQAAEDATPASRATTGDPITVIRRRPHPPMQGDDRLDRRLSRALSALRPSRGTR